jgi:hypothetical protein
MVISDSPLTDQIPMTLRHVRAITIIYVYMLCGVVSNYSPANSWFSYSLCQSDNIWTTSLLR